MATCASFEFFEVARDDICLAHDYSSLGLTMVSERDLARNWFNFSA